MREEADIDVAAMVEAMSETTKCGPFDPMIGDWPIIASIAWEGFVAYGRGHVAVIVDGSEVSFGYRSGAPCRCHAEAVEEYDPEAEVVVVVHIDESVDVYRLGCEPRPADLWAVTPGPLYGATEH